jgi:flagellar motor switch protein FliG
METQRPEMTFIPGRIPTMEIIHDRFVRMFRITISAALRKPVDVSVRMMELVSFGEYLGRLLVPSSLNLFRLNPLNGTAIMALESDLIFNLLDVFYGGGGKLPCELDSRDYTPIEQRLIKRVVISALEDLQTAWNPYYKVQICYQRTEINPMFCAIVPQGETCVVVTFDVDMGGETPTTFTICMPYSMIQPLVLLFKAKRVLKTPVIKTLTGIVSLGYKSTPLPSIVHKATSRIKQNFSVPAPPPVPDVALEKHKDDSEGTLDLLKTVAPGIVAGLVENEHPQTIALILGNIKDSGHAALVLKELPMILQADVSYRMATMEPIPPGVVREIEIVLSRQLKAFEAASANRIGGIESVAEILSAMDAATESRILKTIEDSNSELAEQLRCLMFTMEDLVLINTKGMLAILKETPQNDLVVSLKTASDTVKDHILSSMSKRAAGMVCDDLEALGPVRVADVNLAQQNLLATARRLEVDGKIIISGANQKKPKKKTSKKKTYNKSQQ